MTHHHFTRAVPALALAATMGIGATAADALSFSVSNSSTNVTNANQAATFAADYGAYAPGNGFAAGAVPTTVTPPPGNVGGAYLSPWANTGLADVNSYFVVQPLDANGESASDDPAKLTFGSLQTDFTFLWGSIDIENIITFRNTTSNTDHSVTGTEVADYVKNDTTLSGCETIVSNSFGCVAEVSFSVDDGFDEILFSAGTAENTARNSFEFATPVPLPAAAWLLMGVTGGLFAAKRRHTGRT